LLKSGVAGAGKMEVNKSQPCVIRVSVADMMELQVRRSNASVQPEFLYQVMPEEAMTLFATLPRGDVHVSIPHSRYQIEKAFPPVVDGFILIYSLQLNRSYEATTAIFQNRDFEIGQFCGFAEQWAEDHVGKISVAPGRYIYVSPKVEQWGVILGDKGYVAADPSRLPQGQLAGGVSIRIPVLVGDRQPLGPGLAAFSRVELSINESPWLSFEEYQNRRILQSQLPQIIIQDLRNWSNRLAEESGIASWNFLPGMLFADHAEWWGNYDRRRTEHEGIDFAPIPQGTPVRAIADGEVAAILTDFLDRTVIVRHQSIRNDSAAIFYTLYSHIQPENDLSGRISKGQILGRIGESKSTNAPIHLHLTAAWIPESIRPDELTMTHINPAFAPIVLVNLNRFFKT
jgi:murein DD-endopeptidase MepM/ murein hydrolase activator NlpD